MLDIPIKDRFREARVFHRRLIVAVVVTAIMVLVLLSRLVYLQVVAHRHYETLAQSNRINPVPISPVRGTIFDRNGIVLAKNYPIYTLEVIPERIGDMEAMLTRLGKLISLNESDLKSFRKKLRKRARFESIPLRTHLTDEEAARIAVNRPYLNGVELQARLQRHYPLGKLAVHAIGYVSRISDRDMKRIDVSAYRGTEHIGKLGIEASYEKLLLGKVGIDRVEVNASGRRLRSLEADRIAPKAGVNLHLNLDVRMQAEAERAMGKRRGAVVALDPNTGAILTFVSTPIYDPNPFVKGIDRKSYQALRDDPDKPLFNRALKGQYPPGSTIKPFLALAALESGKIYGAMPVICVGWFKLRGDRYIFHDWKRSGHGEVNVNEAIERSCDVFFYKLATAVGIDALGDYLRAFGFGAKTQIDLKNEYRGQVPSRAFKEAQGGTWYAGETVMAGIGQGPFLVTPLQLASATAMIANGGLRLKPHLVQSIENLATGSVVDINPEALSRIVVQEKHLKRIRDSMVAVVHGRKGTARRISYGIDFQIAGKTGTSQVVSLKHHQFIGPQIISDRTRDHALFISYAPATDPKIAIAVIVENGGHGSTAAAPIARRLIDVFMENQAKETRRFRVKKP